ncbi:AAA domain-containing protein [Alkaliphilus pronyensis]|uniref:AAA domain-containing protein n=1 Tax=Alkaliphilus pronyensis TaxID=1482732 RepID=A0A6I0F6H0_9FIRM|nr:sigma 54-interacting transcriptional regulator [Alkaliphilus pronyensis]KAB3538551.1 AAA domain-containing protein [Alkaliphilus pronyensis]
MAIIDIVLKIDSEFLIKEIEYVGEMKEWFKHSLLFNSVGKNIQHLLNTSIKPEGGILEINSRFFKYQRLEKKDEVILYLSESSVLLDFYNQAINHVSEGIQIFDRNGYFMDCNPASERLENYNKEDFKGKHLLDLYDLEEEYSTVLTVLRTQKAVANRCDRFKTSNGKSLTTVNYGYPLIIDDNLYGAVVFESDFSLLDKMKNRVSDLATYLENEDTVNNQHLYKFDDIVHLSKNMKDTIHFAKKVALSDSSVLIYGETGTGKELMAQSIHAFSSRRHKPFIDINCSAIPSNLFESLFFGTEKGAFTGSVKKQGFFEMANGGTIFLDEINSISLEMQAKLLRVLQEKRVQRIGGSKYFKCNVRIIAASNQDLFELMQKDKIRKDFYYRISTIKIELPSLKERKECIPALANHFLNNLANQYNRDKLVFSKEVIDLFLSYDWPGNIRELQHAVEYSFNFMPINLTTLKISYLPDYLKLSQHVEHKLEKSCKKIKALKLEAEELGLKEKMEEFEEEVIRDTLLKNNGNITESAKKLGMSRQSLQYRMKKLQISSSGAK